MSPQEAATEIRNMCYRIEYEWGACRDEVADDEANEILSALMPRSWDGLLSLIAETYPESMFPRHHNIDDFGNGPQVLSLLRIIEDQRRQIRKLEGETA